MSSFLRTGMLWHLKMSKLFCWQHGQSLTSLLTTLWHLMSKQLSKGMSKMSKISLKWFDGMSILAFQVLTSQGTPHFRARGLVFFTSGHISIIFLPCSCKHLTLVAKNKKKLEKLKITGKYLPFLKVNFGNRFSRKFKFFPRRNDVA